MPHAASRTPRSGTALLATVLSGALLGLTGCGGDDESAPGTGATTTKAASAAPQEAPTTWPPKGTSGELARYPYKYGVSWEVPRDWTLSTDDSEGYELYIWSVKKNQVGLAVNVQNSRSTVEEWKAIVLEGSTKKVVRQEAFSVPGYGKGTHVVFRSKGVTDDLLIVTSVDGVLLQMDVYTARGGDPALAEEILDSVKRTT